MSYTKKTWVKDEVITSVGLNHMEEGIENANSSNVPVGTDRQVLGYINGEPISITLGWKQFSDLNTPPPFESGVLAGMNFNPDGSAMYYFKEINSSINAPARGDTIPVYGTNGVLKVGTGVYSNDAVTKAQLDAKPDIGTTATTAKAGNWTPPNASYNTAGLIKIGNETPQTAEMNVVTLTSGRTYAVQLNQTGHAVVNVPWVNTTYTLPTASTTVRGGVLQALGVEDSDATELVTLRNSFNELLANLRSAGLIT